MNSLTIDEFPSTVDEFCIGNNGFCTAYDGFCINNDGFCIKHDSAEEAAGNYCSTAEKRQMLLDKVVVLGPFWGYCG